MNRIPFAAVLTATLILAGFPAARSSAATHNTTVRPESGLARSIEPAAGLDQPTAATTTGPGITQNGGELAPSIDPDVFLVQDRPPPSIRHELITGFTSAAGGAIGGVFFGVPGAIVGSSLGAGAGAIISWWLR